MNLLSKLKNMFLSLNKKLRFVIATILMLFFVMFFCITWYKTSLSPVNKDSEVVKVSIELGYGHDKIAQMLKDLNLIKNKFTFKLYIKLNNISNLQAGTYYISPNMTVKEIVETLQTGKVANTNEFKVTFIEGKNMRWIAEKIASVTNNSTEDVFNLLNNEEYINKIVSSYWFINDDIKNNDIYYPLEGYLFPDTYTFSSVNITIEEIFALMLNQMDKVLNTYKKDIKNSKYSIHELLSLASVVELEAIHNHDRKGIANVFYNRLSHNMPLGSDVTTYYAFKVDMSERNLYQSELNTYNAYNTRGPNMAGKLPVGPIASVSKVSIEAVLYPLNNNFLFFVSDKNQKMYFAETLSEHTTIINELKTNGLWFEYKK